MEKQSTAQVADAAQNTIQVTEAASSMSFWELATHSGPLAFGVFGSFDYFFHSELGDYFRQMA